MESLLSVVNKSTHIEVSAYANELSLQAPSVVQLAVKRSDIKSIARLGDMLVVTLNSGAVVKVHAFFPAQGPLQNDLVIEDDKQLWWAEFSESGQVMGQYFPIDSIEPLLVNESFDLSTLAWVLGGVALAGAAAGGGGHHETSPRDTTAPGAPTVNVNVNPDGSLTVTGQAEPNSTVKVTYPDGTSGSVVAAADGTYTVTTPPNQPSGQISANATDPAGNTGPATSVEYLDTTAPGAPTVNVNVNPDGSLTVTGQAEPNSTVKVTYPDGTSGSVVAAADGSYSSQSSEDQPTGNVEASASDAAGNNSPTTTVPYVNTTPPAVTSIALTAISTDTDAGLVNGTGSTTNSTSNSDFTTRDSTLMIMGTYAGNLAATGEFLQISADDGVTWDNVTFNNATHTWSYVDNVPRTAATTYQVRAVDSDGNVSAATASQLVNVDVIAPIQSLLAPVLTSAYDSGVQGDGITTRTDLTFTSANSRKAEAGMTVVLINDVNNDGVYSEGIDSVLGAATAAADGSWSITAAGLATGTFQLGFMLVDAAGNRTRLSAISNFNVVSADNSTAASAGWGGTYAQNNTGGATASLGRNGLWSFFQSTSGGTGAAVFNSSDLSTYTSTPVPSAGRHPVGATFADFTRSGYAGVMSVTTHTGFQDYWTTSDGTTYVRGSLTGNSLYYGGVAAYDKTGDGYLDFVLGDNYGDSLTFVTNTNGTLTFMNGTATSGMGRPTGTTLNGFAEVSGVDLENNGTVDIVEHTNVNGRFALTTFKNDQSTTNSFTLASIAGVFAAPTSGNSNVPVSMT
ncbi:Ig-like domain-containing protein [Pseudomonas sp. TH31]|uniref:Ig-like domain-containing protein n=1 Tax=Pseudomonas sp. TH31 TaxID=2796396 RepID=UPI0019144DA0|nr:Ig-like domain-containing protein [Pseudomonas sp. TH31]MBK5416172.1 BapA prefix-like domain-containing protein [Pseudomonas sp. TH31]